MNFMPSNINKKHGYYPFYQEVYNKFLNENILSIMIYLEDILEKRSNDQPLPRI
ncbi:MAG: hypothetical protein O7D30_06525 [Rickettsia endosymbiont of Ixodes persulcatus]|nr:hypothetical protein [Rickettsia endosymbiont of Ixodes persulcatus]